MKIRCYDKYQNVHLIIEFPEDELNLDAFSSHYAEGHERIIFKIDFEFYKNKPGEYAEDPHPKRWSDLIDFEII